MNIKANGPEIRQHVNLKASGKDKKPAVEKAENKTAEAADKVSIGEKTEQKSVFGKIKSWVNTNIRGKEKTADGRSIYKYASDYGSNNKRYAAIGATAGGAIGTAVGMYAGYEDMKTDQIELRYRNHSVDDPKLTGFYHTRQEVGHYESEYVGTDSEGNAQYEDRYVVDGYWHNYNPKIEYTKVGSYETPEYHHSGKWTPLTGGLAGLIGGTAVGALIGLTTSVLQKAIKKHMHKGGK